MKMRTFLACLVISTVAFTACTYRFADPFPARDYDLISVSNSTSEPALGSILEEELRLVGGFTPGSDSRLYVTVTGLSQQIETVSSDGTPVRQKLTLELSWKVEGTNRSEAVFGSETVTELYPYSPDAASLDWTRNAAIRLLARNTAGLLIHKLEGTP